MKKLIVQLPCYNEAESLALVLRGIPAEIPGIDLIETLVLDDGSTDGTSRVANECGATYIVRHKRNLGLAHTFRHGLDVCLEHGADIIVNIDGDNQYKGGEIKSLIAPILSGTADIVVGNRNTDGIEHFTPTKKILQRLGSAIVRKLSKTKVQDTVSGFRAFSREAAQKLTILSNYTYTLESILQVRVKGLTIADIPIETNHVTRKSRLMSNLPSYLTFSMATIIRVFAMYNPLKIFFSIGAVFLGIGGALGLRFLYHYIAHGGAGMIQSVILASIFLTIGVTIILVGLLADIIQFNRRLIEDVLERVKRIEGGK